MIVAPGLSSSSGAQFFGVGVGAYGPVADQTGRSLRAFLQRLVSCAPNLMLVATQAFAPAKRRDTAPRRPPRGGGGPAASAAAASRHSRSARRLVPRGAGGDQGASVFALCRVLVPRTRHAGARRRSSIHLSSSDLRRRRATASGPYSSQPTIPPS